MTLIQLFTAIANAIRGKTGSSNSIPAQNFPQEIAGITTGKLTNEEYEEADEDVDDILENTTVPSGTISITANGEYDVTNYTDANVNVVSLYNAKIDTTKTYSENYGICSIITDIGLLDTSNMTSMQNMFSNFLQLQEIPLLDTSNVVNFYGIFSGCTSLTEIPLFNTGKVTNMSNMFYACTSLTEIPLLDTSMVSNFFYFAYMCSNLVTVPILDMSSATNINKMFTGCSLLSNNSLNNIMAMCLGATSYTGTKTLRQIGLTSTQATTCTGLSNYTAFTAAGWTTGY